MFSKKIFWLASALLLIGVQAQSHQMDVHAQVAAPKTELSHKYPAVNALLWTFFWQAAECCQEKTVGGVSYSLLPEDFHGSLPHQCLTSCVYTKTGMLSSPKFCFARGFANSLYMCCVLFVISLVIIHNVWVTFCIPRCFFFVFLKDFFAAVLIFCIPRCFFVFLNDFLQPFWFFLSIGDLATECRDPGSTNINKWFKKMGIDFPLVIDNMKIGWQSAKH